MEQYPAIGSIITELVKVTEKVIAVDASQKAKELGLSESANVVLLGRLTREGALLHFHIEIMKRAVKETTPPKYLDINLKALAVG